MRIYLDNAATTPLDPQVAETMLDVMQNKYGNPSSIHAHGREVRTLVEEARKTVAKLLNVTPSEIFFTSGGTEADNMAIRCSVEDLGVKRIITSPIEHHAVLHTIEEMGHKGKAIVEFVKLTANGHIDLDSLEELLKKEEGKTLVSLMYANNEIGNLLDTDAVSALCEKYGALFHCDTVQAMGHYPLDLQKTKIDFIACAAHKFNGPKGVGFIYISNRNRIKPLITGGAQERNMRGGTENVYGIIGLAKALEISCEHMEEKAAHISGLKNYMIRRLEEEIPGIEFNGDAKGRSLYTVLNVSFPPSKVSDMMLFKLDIEGISASGGSACSSGSDVGSHVLGALGVDSKRANVRFSFGKFNTKEEIDYVISKLKEMHQPAETSTLN
ncbi:MAG: aminotransferase class V-fold PLP-dependent enzyme [Bacteroidetes bacterium]|nr:aminotransferase class V-fold PLP-dependent enzyme [Bacteroidota bacterium]